ncbi:hypothetical protein C8R45DRAFT_942809 [Mycena sanguinolenta]|nr:hypothetical protein C8R45DRAFT_942809 [Mycena sanguinolenta]
MPFFQLRFSAPTSPTFGDTRNPAPIQVTFDDEATPRFQTAHQPPLRFVRSGPGRDYVYMVASVAPVVVAGGLVALVALAAKLGSTEAKVKSNLKNIFRSFLRFIQVRVLYGDVVRSWGEPNEY